MSQVTTDDQFRQKFYDQANEYIKSLNPKFREKAVITLAMNDKIIRCMSNIHTQEFNSRFISWCRTAFILQQIGSNVLVCDTKTCKPVLIYEMMYNVFKKTHLETAHGGRDKCMDSLLQNYSWYSRNLLQIYIKNCGSCQKRKPIKIPMLSKPIIALESSLHSIKKQNNDVRNRIFTSFSKLTTTDDSFLSENLRNDIQNRTDIVPSTKLKATNESDYLYNDISETIFTVTSSSKLINTNDIGRTNNDIQQKIFTSDTSKLITTNDSRHELYRNTARTNYLKAQNKRQKTYDEHLRKIADSFKNGDLVGISINKVDRTNCDPKIMPCIIEKRSDNSDIPMYRVISPFGRISTSFPVHQLIPMSGIKPTVLQNISFETVPTISFIQACKLYARGNLAATCDCKTKCLTKTCPCRRASIPCSTKCHAKLGKCTNSE